MLLDISWLDNQKCTFYIYCNSDLNQYNYMIFHVEKIDILYTQQTRKILTLAQELHGIGQGQ